MSDALRKSYDAYTSIDIVAKDGDTIVVSPLDNSIQRKYKTIRVQGINTQEVTSHNILADEARMLASYLCAASNYDVNGEVITSVDINIYEYYNDKGDDKGKAPSPLSSVHLIKSLLTDRGSYVVYKVEPTIASAEKKHIKIEASDVDSGDFGIYGRMLR